MKVTGKIVFQDIGTGSFLLIGTDRTLELNGARFRSTLIELDDQEVDVEGDLEGDTMTSGATGNPVLTVKSVTRTSQE